MKNIAMILGHGQDFWKPSGLRTLAQLIDHSTERDCHIRLYNWDTKIETIIKNNVGPLMLVGYSYGGSSANFVAHALKARDIPVEYMMLIDAVWRKKRYRATLKSVSKKKKIILSDNIGTVYSWRRMRENAVIAGHKVIAARGTTHYACKIKLRHADIDDSPVIHRVIAGIAKDFIES